MKNLKLFPKIFFYTFGMMLLIVFITHGLIYLFAPRMELAWSADEAVVVSINQMMLIAGAIRNALPVSFSCALLISLACSLLFARTISDPIRSISASTGEMMELKQAARCNVRAGDEIGILAQNINDLYANLLSMIEHLEQEKETVREMEQAKADFLRAASHELKTPLTALNATLENMILGIGRYRDYAACLPECKELAEQLSVMIREILEASKPGLTDEPPTSINPTLLLQKISEPYRLIAAAHQIRFSLDLPQQFCTTLPANMFCKAVSNILANAVAYTKAGNCVRVYMDGRRLIIENECIPIPANEIHRLFEPFYRPDFSRSRDDGGNGLGLYIADTLFSSMGISYSFKPMDSPKGMRFTIFL